MLCGLLQKDAAPVQHNLHHAKAEKALVQNGFERVHNTGESCKMILYAYIIIANRCKMILHAYIIIAHRCKMVLQRTEWPGINAK
jgi:hypothetical protein